MHRCPNLGLLPHPELVDEQKVLKLKEQLNDFCSEDSLNQVHADSIFSFNSFHCAISLACLFFLLSRCMVVACKFNLKSYLLVAYLVGAAN
jgi:hypothetical protein